MKNSINISKFSVTTGFFIGTKFIFAIFLIALMRTVSAQSSGWVWANNIIPYNLNGPGLATDGGKLMATDVAGNVYLAGSFRDSISFSGITITGPPLVSSPYIVKYDEAGNVLWAHSGVASSSVVKFNYPWGIATDAGGNLYLCGTFSTSTITFGSTTLSSANGQNIYLVKYDANGNVLWAKSEGGNDNGSSGNSVATDASGNLYMCGSFTAPTITFGSTTLSNSGGSDAFFTKYDASGNAIWAKKEGGSSNDWASGITIDASGNICIAGGFHSSSITIGSSTLSNSGGDDIYIAKYDGTGNALWAKKAAGSGDEYAPNIGIDAQGNIYISGNFSSPTLTFTNLSVTNSTVSDIFLAKYNSGGTAQWAKKVDGNNSDYSSFICVDPTGNVNLFGSFSYSSITFGNYTLTNSGSYNSYLVKYDGSGTVLNAQDVQSSGCSGIASDADGNLFISGTFMTSAITLGNITLNNVSGGDSYIAKNGMLSCNVTYYADADGDGFGNSNVSVTTCTQPNGYITNHTDCNDNNNGINPNASEVANGIDDNCNGLIDYDDPGLTGVNLSSNIQPDDTSICAGQSVTLTTMTVAVNPCPSIPANLTQGLVAYYPFCGNALDATGNGNDGTVNGATLVTDRFGNPSRAYHFGGSNYIIGPCDNFPADDRTVSIWYKIDDWSNHNTLMGYGGDPCGTSFFAILNETNHPNQFTTSGHCEAHNISVSTSYVQNSNWNNWIITTKNNETKFYLNGVLINTSSNYFFDTHVSGKDFAFGSMSSTVGDAPYTDGNISKLKGSLDDIVIYNRALNSTEVQQLYDFFNSNQTVSTTYLWSTGATTSSIIVNPSTTTTYTLTTTQGAISETSTVTVLVGGGSTVFYQDADADGYGNPNVTILACTTPSGYVTNNFDCDDANASINPAAPPTKQFDARFGGTTTDKMNYILQTSDGGYLLGGLSKSGISGDKTEANFDGSNATSDFWIVKSNASGAKQWDKTFGGTGDEGIIAMQQTSDGGFILGGSSASGISGNKTQANWDATNATADYWIVKTDANGVKLWDKRFGGTDDDQLQALQQTSDGGYILGGFSSSGISGDKSQASQGGQDYWIVKVDASGNKTWDKTFGGSSTDGLYAIRQTADGGYILGGKSLSPISGDKSQANRDASNATYDYWIIRTDASGNKSWDKTFGGSSSDFLFALRQAADGGFILGGYSNSPVSGDKTQATQGGNDYWIVKTDASGNKSWDARFGGSSDDFMYTLQLTADGGFLLGGSSSSPLSGDKSQGNQGNRDFWIVKTNASGVKQWDQRYGGAQQDQTTGMQQTTDGGYIIGGPSFSGISGDKTQANWDASNGTNDYWMIKLSSNTGQQTFYADADGDGYGTSTGSVLACSAPSGYVSNSTDCNDGNAAVHPGAVDVCTNGIDDNCNGVIDENAITATVTPAGTVSTCSGVNITLTANLGAGIFYQWKKGNKDIAGATNSTYSASKAAGYKVYELNSFGCSSTSAVTTVNVLSAPTATITPLGNLDICGTGSVVLQANSGSGLTYQWMKGTANINGATNQNYTATAKATYKVVVTNSSGCSKTSAGAKVTKSCKEASLENNEIPSSTLTLYPNPSTGKFIIDLKFNEEINDEASIEVMNLVGQIVYSEKLAITDGELKKEISFDHSLADGMYLVRVNVNEKIYSAQLIYQQ